MSLLGSFVGALVLAWLFVRSRPVGPDGRRVRSEDLPASLWFAVVAYSLAAPLLYLTVPTYWDHVEPAMAMKSLALARGEPLYPAINDASRTQMVYGPAAYLLQSWTLGWFSNPVFGSKLTGMISGWSGIGVLAFLWARRRPGSHARLAMFYCLATLLLFRQVLFRNQTDGVLFLGIALAGGAVVGAAPGFRTVLWALGIGLALGAKLHGVVYALPLVPALIKQEGLGRVVVATGAGVLFAIAPFSRPCCDLQAFVGIVQAFSGHDRPVLLLLRNLCSAAVVVVPLGIALVEELDRSADRSRRAEVRLTFTTIGLSLFVASYVGAKEGWGGPTHLIPFAATFSSLLMLSYGRIQGVNIPHLRRASLHGSLLVAWLCAVLIQGAIIQQSYLQFVVTAQDGRVAEEAMRIRDSLVGRGHRIAFGYTDDANYGVSFVRPHFWPILSVNLLEPLSLADLQHSGHALAPSTIELFARQSFDLVILPSGGTPFSMTNWFDPRERLFGAELTPVFQSNYQVYRKHEFFTLWRANRLAGPGT